jgi:hypothetical protein
MTLAVNESNIHPVKARRIVAIMITLTVLFGGFGIQGADAQSIDGSNIFIPRRLAAVMETVSAGFPDVPVAAIEVIDPRVTAIRTYFENLNMPAADYAEAFVRAADENDFEYWALLPAIARQETTGCKYTLYNPLNTREWNCFGFGKMDFASIEEGINYVAATLAGNKPQTDHYYSKDKTLEQLLHHYNSVNKNYYKSITTYMASIEALLPTTVAVNS